MHKLYLLLTILGIALPYGAFLPWLFEHGLAMGLLLEQAFINPISAVAWLDVFVAGVTLIVFIVTDSRANQVSGSLFAIIGTLTVGVSFGLPLYLYLRHRQLYPQQTENHSRDATI